MAAMGLSPDQVQRAKFCFELPKIGDPIHMDALERFITEDELEVLFIDPAYLCIPIGDSAGNLFTVGEYLSPLSVLGQKTGCTLGVAHHTKKNKDNPFAPAELEDISWAGFQEWCRQWILISRREMYDAEQPGRHCLWMNSGGSAGHSSLWALNVHEGSPRDEGGRRWEVELIAPSSARSAAVEQQAQQKEQKQRDKRNLAIKDKKERIEKILRASPQGCTETKLRSEVGRIGEALSDLLEEKKVVATKIKVRSGKKGSREVDGFILANPGHET
jgi:hypothetical protein